MTTYLLQTGADVRDIRGDKCYDFPVIRQWRAGSDIQSWNNLQEKILDFEDRGLKVRTNQQYMNDEPKIEEI